ncbi:MAG TPA: hypothetical protein V6C71_08670 [Coleofasciculaceae cyanobacterium]
MNIEQLRKKYLKLVNEELPARAKQREFPVHFNHCFARIILDNLFNRCWYEVIDRQQSAAYKQLSVEQLERGVCLAEDFGR